MFQRTIIIQAEPPVQIVLNYDSKSNEATEPGNNAPACGWVNEGQRGAARRSATARDREKFQSILAAVKRQNAIDEAVSIAVRMMPANYRSLADGCRCVGCFVYLNFVAVFVRRKFRELMEAA